MLLGHMSFTMSSAIAVLSPHGPLHRDLRTPHQPNPGRGTACLNWPEPNVASEQDSDPTGQIPSGHEAAGRGHLRQQGLYGVQAQRVPDHRPELPIADVPATKVVDTVGQPL